LAIAKFLKESPFIAGDYNRPKKLIFAGSKLRSYFSPFNGVYGPKFTKSEDTHLQECSYFATPFSE